eukprot:6178759-Pleurochrysis_carterae.AAC.2
MLIRSKGVQGECDKHGAFCEGENAAGPSAPAVLVTSSIRRPEVSEYKDKFAWGSPRRRRKA